MISDSRNNLYLQSSKQSLAAMRNIGDRFTLSVRIQAI